MPHALVRQKLRDMCRSKATLLWLEGAKHDRVSHVSLNADRLVITLESGLTRVVAFEKYAVTSVGLQLWSQGRPGVLYQWDQVPRAAVEEPVRSDDDGGNEPPPDMAA